MIPSDEARLTEPSDAEREPGIRQVLQTAPASEFGRVLLRLLDEARRDEAAAVTVVKTWMDASETLLRERDEARRERDEAREVCAEAYQVVGALTHYLDMKGDDAVKPLDNLLAAAEGEPIPHATLLPYPKAYPPLVAQLDIANERLGESERQLNAAWIKGDSLSAQLSEQERLGREYAVTQAKGVEGLTAQVEEMRAALILAEDLYQRGALFVSAEEWETVHAKRRKALGSTPSPAHPEEGK